MTNPVDHSKVVGVRTRLAGWGANARTEGFLAAPAFASDVRGVLDRSGSVARGLGRSYGDAATNAERQVIGMTAADRFLAFDEETGTLTCEAGTSLESIIAVFAPRGWFPMITPGTKFVTVGGCIANDIHGKAHHVDGCFSNCVDEFTVLLASGEIVLASREQNPDLFWATFGGMGLLGIVLTATIRLRKIETTYFRQKSIKVDDLEEMLAALDEYDSIFPYSVATLDVMATGERLGKGVLTVGDHATLGQLPEELVANPLTVSGPPKIAVPIEMPDITLNPLSIRLVNAAIQKIQSSGGAISHYEKFFYPLDKIANWNRGYGKRGFTQYQFVIPFENGMKRMREILQTILSSGELPFLNVLKRFGREGLGTLSFPREGYTFAIDFPIRANTVALTRRLDAMILDAGGRIYLGKDSFVEPQTFRAMYPGKVEQFLAVKEKYDPEGVFTSDLGRRVQLSK
ncbi:FAD-binding protein [Silvibacterium acidisoli]|uniref:FAD-binding protein n=1 Tax=Acidobacteriaceae bacterium ZG23-2 TaxID=2883246 RepID=UPI00406C5668